MPGPRSICSGCGAAGPRGSTLSRAAIAAGLVAGLGGGWLLQNAVATGGAALPGTSGAAAVRTNRPAFRSRRSRPSVPRRPRSRWLLSPGPRRSPLQPSRRRHRRRRRQSLPRRRFRAVARPNEPPPASDGRRAVQEPPRPPEVALPFDASLQTILFGPERRLAIVDGRIVGEGDEIKGARVVEITPERRPAPGRPGPAPAPDRGPR